MPDTTADIGIIGGSGLYNLPELTSVRSVRVPTPFGEASEELTLGVLGGRKLAFLPRHGRGHRLSPTHIPYRANIYALKSIGVRQVISLSAVGSLREEYAPGHLVIPDQLVDRTRGSRASSFFTDGIVAHVPFASPFCDRLRPLASQAAMAAGATTHQGGVYCCMEGPQFSTRSESELYRAWGADVIGMTAAPEAHLAREAELCYVTVAMVTDYDCWRPGDETVTADAVAAVMARNVELARATIAALVHAVDTAAECSCQHALANAILTDLRHGHCAVQAKEALLIGKYLPGSAASTSPAAPRLLPSGHAPSASG